MNCIEFEKRLHEQFYPARLEEAVDLSEHAQHCAACRNVLEHFRVLSDGLSAWREQVPEVDLTGAVVSASKLQREQPIEGAAQALVVASHRHRAGRSRQSDLANTAGIVARSPWLPGRFRSRRNGWLAAAAAVGLLLVAVYFVSPPGGEAPRFMTQVPMARAPEALATGGASKDAGEEPAIPAVDRAEPLPEAVRDVYY